MDERDARGRPRFYGKYRGVVVDNADAQHRGRLRVRVPAVLGELAVWALPCVPYAGRQRGFFAMPDEGTGVWVEFEGGHSSYPIWTGCFWAEGDLEEDEAKPHVKFFRTETFTLRVDDRTGEVAIENDGGTQILLTSIDLTLRSSKVHAEAPNGRKVVIAATSVSVNDGALEVT
ncbi:MAG: hypothetical protein KF901_27975 [Myxococcales bacterium]|nr:hypothetical protein [Myxococcales bacterium]